MMEALFFWLFSLGMLGFGLAVVLNPNPVASALCFVGTIACMAALFVMLSAFFLAAVQILVTAGAVMVLFLFIIMLLNVGVAERLPRQRLWMACTLVLALGFVALFARILRTLTGGAELLSIRPPIHESHRDSFRGMHDDIHQIGHLLFGPYVAPFEITSLLILVATVGVIVLSRDPRPAPPPAATPAARPTSPRPRA